jgi:hypothetical protein
MRTSLLVLFVCILAVPAVGTAALMRGAGDGELSVASGRGKVTVDARGGIFGRFVDGRVQILDLTPDDPFVPTVFGDERLPRELANGAVLYRGTNVRFRLVGGGYRITVTGIGIDISAVGNGSVWLESDKSRLPGTFSLDGVDCSALRAKCRPLPETRTVFKLGSADSESALPRPLG